MAMGIDQIIGRRRVARGEMLYRMNDPFHHLYAICIGHFKMFQINPEGKQQIIGFQMASELMGMDAISTERHHCNVAALEDSAVCEIPFQRLEELFGVIPTLLSRLLSRFEQRAC